MHPGFPPRWDRAPLSTSRAKTATPPRLALSEATYRCLASGLIASAWGITSAVARVHAPRVPVADTQPTLPAGWTSSALVTPESAIASIATPASVANTRPTTTNVCQRTA